MIMFYLLLVVIVVGTGLALGSYALNGELDQFWSDLKSGFKFSHDKERHDG